MAESYKEDSRSQNRSDEKILEEALSRFRLAEEAEQDIRAQALEDLEFRSGKHWPDEIRASRDRDGRPCLVINRIPQFIQQVTNDQRQNRPSIKVHAVDDQADPETAKVIQGLIRHIEYNSNADVAYDTAFDSAATGGFGYFRIVTDYVNPTSFEQEILIKRIRNPFSVFFDPNSQEPDGSDANFAFVVDELSKDEFCSKYPESKLARSSEWEAIGNTSPDWVTKNTARVAEYFYKESKTETLCLYDGGNVVLKSDKEGIAALEAQGLKKVSERKTHIPVIRWCKITATDILEKTEWPGIYIPIIPVYGNELYINGKRILEGVVRNAKDSQRMYNYWASAETEAIALAPRAPFVAAEGQLEGHEAQWATANVRNHAVLQYKPVTVNGQPAPPPMRMAVEPAVQAITQARMIAADDLKATTGIYDAALGAKSNETSGVAIQRRNIQAQTSNFHFIDNLTRSLRHAGRIIVDLIPKIYDTERAARIIGEDGEQKVVRLNASAPVDGQDSLYALDVGKYDVTVDVGPSFASKRQEAVASMLEMTRAVPQLIGVAGDLLFKAMDTPYASEISERLKKTLPPGIAEDKQNKQIPPEVQAHMAQMDQMVGQLTEQLNALQSEREKKLLELESKERIEMKKLEVQLEIERAKLDAKDAITLLNAEIQSIESRLGMLRMSAPIDTEQGAQDLPQEQPQEFALPDAGGEPAMGAPEVDDLTGEVPPGSPMEGNFQ